MPNDLIPVGATVTATLTLDGSAVTAELYIVDQDYRDATVVTASASVSITPRSEGQLRVVVTASNGTSGRLTVAPGGVDERLTLGDHEERFTVVEFSG